jgi:hypothetical protein
MTKSKLLHRPTVFIKKKHWGCQMGDPRLTFKAYDLL